VRRQALPVIGHLRLFPSDPSDTRSCGDVLHYVFPAHDDGEEENKEEDLGEDVDKELVERVRKAQEVESAWCRTFLDIDAIEHAAGLSSAQLHTHEGMCSAQDNADECLRRLHVCVCVCVCTAVLGEQGPPREYGKFLARRAVSPKTMFPKEPARAAVDFVIHLNRMSRSSFGVPITQVGAAWSDVAGQVGDRELSRILALLMALYRVGLWIVDGR